MKTVRDFNFKNKRVLVRCDFNVPLPEKGDVLDDFRIKASLPTLEYLIKKGAKLLLMSHLGRPFASAQNQKSKAERQFVEARREKRTKFSATIKNQKYSLKPVASRLGKLLKRKVHPVKPPVKLPAAGFNRGIPPKAELFNRVKFLDDCIGKKVEEEIEKMKPGGIILLENLRFYKQEQENDRNFAKALSGLGDIFINDAFSVCHRSHASVVGITKYLPSGAGLLLEKEIRVLSQIMKNPKRPLVVIIGGKKVEDKAKVVEKFSKMADFVLTGGLVAEEIKKGKIRIKEPQKTFFPVDNKDSFDIGEKTIKIFKEKIQKAKTIFWAGPLGKIEDKKYQKGTKEIARAIVESGAFSIVGGGDTIKFINKINSAEKFSHVSMGGGAMLEFLAGEKLPGLRALNYGD